MNNKQFENCFLVIMGLAVASLILYFLTVNILFIIMFVVLGLIAWAVLYLRDYKNKKSELDKLDELWMGNSTDYQDSESKKTYQEKKYNSEELSQILSLAKKITRKYQLTQSESDRVRKVIEEVNTYKCYIDRQTKHKRLNIHNRGDKTRIDYIKKLDSYFRRSNSFEEYYQNKKKIDEYYLLITEDKNSVQTEIDAAEKIKQSVDKDSQWIIRNIIERTKEEKIQLIIYKFKNSKQHQKEVYDGFKELLDEYKSEFDKETEQFAEDALRDLEKRTGLDYEMIHDRVFEEKSIIPIEEIDNMEGITFEKICADILSYNGFKYIKVTPGSGDQGIDILAEKDDIKYAIQCKRYSSRLGNTPVQEVLAGRKYYKCQIGVVMTNNYFTPGAIELAENTGILLWDRDKLIEMLNNKKEK